MSQSAQLDQDLWNPSRGSGASVNTIQRKGKAMVIKRSLVGLLILNMTSVAFADDLENSIAKQAKLIAQASASSPSRAAQTETQPSSPQQTHGRESKMLAIAGVGMIAFGSTLIAYGQGGFGNCTGPAGSTQVYSAANACYSDKITGWMLGVGSGTILLLGSFFTRNK